ncbi:MAG TPA: class I SAM-dependent methyltransferase [Actinomycetota bacterium]|nr:class I SAM-dependent methyltransferase [Actinomycetota bacterium]
MNELSMDPYALMVDFYDEWSAHMTADIDFYVRKAAEARGPIVELGAGTGRVSIPLAAAGAQVIAVDNSDAMLVEGARRAAAAGLADRIRFVPGDMRTYVADPPVELVIIPFRSFLHLMTMEDQLSALDAIMRSLEPGGRLIMNVFTPDPALMVAYDGQRKLQASFVDERGRRNEIWSERHNDLASQTLHYSVTQEVYEGDAAVASATADAWFELHMMYPFEMRHLLARAGFALEAMYGDFDERPYGPGPDEMIVIARKP